jgi:integrase
MVRYSREDALTRKELVLLLEGAERLKEPKRLQAKFIIMTSAKMGMRGGEIAHIDSSWIKESEKYIEIPKHDKCRKGKFDGEVCGYCRRRAKDYIDNHNISKDEAINIIIEKFGHSVSDEKVVNAAKNLIEDHNKELGDVVSDWWQPKTPQSARSIPYDFSVRLQLCVERFFDKYDEFPISKSSLNRRVEEAKEESHLQKRIYPHSLRATAATVHASRGVSPHSLMSVMGWQQLDTARTYISASDETAAIELRSKH